MHSQSNMFGNQTLNELWGLAGFLEYPFSAEVLGTGPPCEKFSGFRCFYIGLNNLKLNENLLLFWTKEVIA